MNRRVLSDLAVACLLVTLGVLTRLLPHAPNFTAVGAATLFASFYLRDWRLAPAIPLTTLALSDMVAGAYEFPLMTAVYASSLLPWLLGRTLRSQVGVARLVCCSVGSSVGFFLATNFSVWLFGNWYSADWNGLVSCFAAGVPFFRYTFLSDLVYSAAIFGTYSAVVYLLAGMANRYGWSHWKCTPVPVAA